MKHITEKSYPKFLIFLFFTFIILAISCGGGGDDDDTGGGGGSGTGGGSTGSQTQSSYCTGLPSNAKWNTASSITQTLHNSNNTWVPTNAGNYNTTASTTFCHYVCLSGFKWSGSACTLMLDSGFGEVDSTTGEQKGYITNNNAAGGNCTDWGLSCTIDSSGNVFVTGISHATSASCDTSIYSQYSDVAIWKYNANGFPDATFGTGGIAINSNALGGDGRDFSRSIYVDGSGNVFIAGSSTRNAHSATADTFDMALWKFTTAGVLDTSFGTGGVVSNNNVAGGDFSDIAYFVTGDTNGNLYLTGSSNDPNGLDDLVVWKYKADGTLDAGFSTDGIYTHNNLAGGNTNDVGYSLALDSNGKVVVQGVSWGSNNNYDMVLLRLNTDGTLDTTFGTNGIIRSDRAANANGHDYPGQSVGIDGDGNIFVTGSSYNGSNYDMMVWKYDSAGAAVSAFGTNGVARFHSAAGGFGDDRGWAISLDSSGNVYVTGVSDNGTNKDMVIWKVHNNNGTLDLAFGDNGVIVHDNTAGGNGNEEGEFMFVHPTTGKLVVCGYSESSSNIDMALWMVSP